MKKVVLALALAPLFAFANGGGGNDYSDSFGEPVSDAVLDSIHGTTSPYICGRFSESRCLGIKPHSLCLVGTQDNGYIGHCMGTPIADMGSPIPTSSGDMKTPANGNKVEWSCICR